MNPIQRQPDELFRPYALAALIAQFEIKYHSFDNPSFISDEITYKRGAQARVRELLSKEQLDKLIAGQEFEEAKAHIKRACAGIFGGVQNNLLNKFDMLAITNAPAEPLVQALYNLLYGTGSFAARFEAWVEVLSHDKTTVWPTATYFLMMQDSSRYIFVKPEPYKKLLRVLHSKGVWETHPTATRYMQLLSLASALLSKLALLGAKDMMDVQSFIYVMFPSK
jgi:hypothetical protein